MDDGGAGCREGLRAGRRTSGAAMTARERAAHFLYSLVLRALQPLYALRLHWRGRVEPLYRERIAERFGFYAEPASSGWLWLHAVSLGETRAAAALIAALRERL